MITCPHKECTPQVYFPSDFGWGLNRLEDPAADRIVTCVRGCGKEFIVSQPVFTTVPRYPVVPSHWLKRLFHIAEAG